MQRLEGSVPPADQLRVLRAIEALEWIGTPEARELLLKLSKGAAGCRQTQEAKASLARLTGAKR